MLLQKFGIVQSSRASRASNKSKAKKVNFTQARVEGLRHSGSGPEPEYVYDNGKPGLAIRLTASGVRTYVFVGRLHGKLASRHSLGRVESLHLGKARAAVDKIRGDIALGIDVVAEWKALKTSLDHTVADIAHRNLRSCSGRRHSAIPARAPRSA